MRGRALNKIQKGGPCAQAKRERFEIESGHACSEPGYHSLGCLRLAGYPHALFVKITNSGMNFDHEGHLMGITREKE